jgi:hypothetical protein
MVDDPGRRTKHSSTRPDPAVRIDTYTLPADGVLTRRTADGTESFHLNWGS